MRVLLAKQHVKCAIFLCILLAVAVPGCSQSTRPDLGLVQGTVTLDGKPLPGAAVIFMPQPGRASRGKTDKNGHYELVYIRDIMGAKVGECNVSISTFGESSGEEQVPVQYNRSTTLMKTVEQGENVIDFDLKSS